MPTRDYYEVLGVSRNVNGEEIRKAFRKQALEFHPDRNKSPGAEEQFKEINEAYQVLSDSKKRAQYDAYGHAGVNGNGGFDRPFEGFDGFGGFGDIFDSFFGDGSGRRTRQAQRGGDLESRVALTFAESVFGVEREVDVARLERCEKCSGAGNEPGTAVNNCATCRGSGQVTRTQRSVFGQFAQITTCTSCQGSGKTFEQPCSDCRASGMQRRQRKIAVKIPAGVEHGMQVRLTNEGDMGSNGGPAGNLYVSLTVRPHELFERDGNDLVYVMSLNLAEASLGGTNSIPTLDGEDHLLKFPPGTQPGQEFRISGKGVPHLHVNRRGDLRVLTNLTVPSKLNARQRALLEEFARTMNNSDGVVSDNSDEIPSPGPNGTSPAGTSPTGSWPNGEAEPATDGTEGHSDVGPEAAEPRKDKGFFDRIKGPFS